MSRLVHMPDGFTPASRGRVRAHCSCGYCTTPRADEVRAAVALDSEHGETQPTCELCGREHFRPGGDWARRFDALQVRTDDGTGDQVLVCADDERACWERSARRHAQQSQRPALRLLQGGQPEAL